MEFTRFRFRGRGYTQRIGEFIKIEKIECNINFVRTGPNTPFSSEPIDIPTLLKKYQKNIRGFFILS